MEPSIIFFAGLGGASALVGMGTAAYKNRKTKIAEQSVTSHKGRLPWFTPAANGMPDLLQDASAVTSYRRWDDPAISDLRAEINKNIMSRFGEPTKAKEAEEEVVLHVVKFHKGEKIDECDLIVKKGSSYREHFPAGESLLIMSDGLDVTGPIKEAKTVYVGLLPKINYMDGQYKGKNYVMPGTAQSLPSEYRAAWTLGDNQLVPVTWLSRGETIRVGRLGGADVFGQEIFAFTTKEAMESHLKAHLAKRSADLNKNGNDLYFEPWIIADRLCRAGHATHRGNANLSDAQFWKLFNEQVPPTVLAVNRKEMLEKLTEVFRWHPVERYMDQFLENKPINTQILAAINYLSKHVRILTRTLNLAPKEAMSKILYMSNEEIDLIHARRVNPEFKQLMDYALMDKLAIESNVARDIGQRLFHDRSKLTYSV